MKFSYAWLLLLAACQTTAEPYEQSSRSLGADEYELVLRGAAGVGPDTLKGFFQVQGKILCGDKVYLLRGMREEFYTDENRTNLTGAIDCVGLDYFE